MINFILLLTAIAFIATEARNVPQIEIYEIRKNIDDSDLRVDDEYFDPDRIRNEDYENIYRNKEVDIVTSDIIDKLKRIVKSQKKYHKDDDDVDDDIMYKYGDLQNNDKVDDRKIPVVIVGNPNALYHIIPQKSKRLRDELQSALRSDNFNNGVHIEDRTAPPRVRINYDYDYRQ